ncbi:MULTISPECIES: TetR/AcrR family transcriptional regulator [Micromonospora]|uniref:Transcriptional regulator, TetR family n=1 Tax=Micromonospora rifamycinica TaxID=291594 RepID=A0A120F8W8_9ACTN|nr:MULTISPECIES: TetR/AcrR family transcriptional regulator [Micromonospora]KWV32252.1 transcriptional regulator [Micromonospora rifamycinica]WFE66706.1 TetR/AcrR family transcriptional regulator [Micromonospora sp. WMMD714]SCG81404.1 transcriptional regulator, TetR family [Micromonospora rifamycinica]
MTDVNTTADAPRSPGRPRSARADEAIIEATLDLLAEGSTIEALSIEAIAARAGVGKATIYRRWAGKETLLLDALRRLKGVAAQPAGQSVRDDLVLLVGAVGHNVDPRAARIMPCLLPEVNRSPDHFHLYQNIIEPRRKLMRDVLRRGVATGELRADLDIEVAMALLTGPMLIQRLLRWHPELDDRILPEKIVDGVLTGLRAR